MKKLTNEIIDQKLIDGNRLIKRIGDYVGSKCKMNWQCLAVQCNYIWKVMPDNILNNNTGCPKCSGNLPLSNYIIDQKLIENNRQIKRIGNYINSKTKINWQCLVKNCNYIWLTIPVSVINNYSGCPKCSGNLLLTNEIIDQRLVDNNRLIKRIEDCIDGQTKINWQCLIYNCNYIWVATPSHVLISTGCPKCSRRLRLTDDMIDQKLLENNRQIKRLGNCINARTNTDWQCLICNYSWLSTPDSILNKKTGCPKCKLYRNEKIMVNLFQEFSYDFIAEFSLSKIKPISRQFKFDLYSNKYRLAIEYDGRQHFEVVKYSKKMSDEQALAELKERQINDEYKNNFCKENNIKLIRIDGRIYKNEKLINHIKEIIADLKEE